MSLPTDERYTPAKVLNVVRTFAPIELDPCAPLSNPVGAERIYTESDSGLDHEWRVAEGKIVFTNSPYSRGELFKWSVKSFKEHGYWRTEIVQLTPADMSTRWARMLLSVANAVAFWNWRIAFLKPDGTYESGAKQPSAFWYFGERQGRFKRVFEQHASVVVLR